MTAKGEPEVLFREFPKQRTFAEAALSGVYKYLCYGGAIRSGKTFLVLALLIALCKIFPKSRWAIVRKDLPTLKRNVFPAFEKIRPKNFVGPICKTSPHEAVCTNGSVILFFPESLDVDPELERWKGLEVNGFVLEEAPELAERSFNKAIERAGSWIIPGMAVQPPPLVFATCNPSPGWVKRKFRDPHHIGTLTPPWFFLQATAEDNPWIPEEVKRSWENLPERDYNRFVLGKWDDLAGSALDELDEARHLIPKFTVPDYWKIFGAFDWGYAHPWVFGVFGVNEDGDVFLIDTIRGRRQKDPAIIERILTSLPEGITPERFSYIHAGHDCFSRYEAHASDNTPTTAERFAKAGLPLAEANIARKAGLKNLREYLGWRPAVEGAEEMVPAFRILRTPNNVRTFDRLTEVLIDPDNAEDALKTDADPESGEGGDDEYDMVRYGIASRPPRAMSSLSTETRSAWDPEMLEAAEERVLTGTLPQPKRKSRDLAAEAGF